MAAPSYLALTSNEHVDRPVVPAGIGPQALALHIKLCWKWISSYFTSKYTDKKENQIFLIYKEIQNGAVAKSYITNGLLIYD